MRDSLTVTLSLDVEEEGLFCGRYRCKNVTVENVASLSRLTPFIRRGIRPTLFCAWPVFEDARACETLEKLKPDVEIGAHLHHWNTPPIAQNIPASGELLAVPAHQAPLQLLEAKLEHLLESGRKFTGHDLTSFRMGRWDLHAPLLPILAKHGIRCDASVRPLHTHASKDKGPDHFGAPADPYRITTPYGRILEAPLTVAPIFAPLAYLPRKGGLSKRIAGSLKSWGALALLPVQHPLWLMKLTTLMHTASGGSHLSLTWHSSEMAPGFTPHLPDSASVDHFLNKVSRYLDWLESAFDITYAPLSQLYEQNHPDSPVPSASCDWTWQGGRENAA